jgi:hypothetical protein
MKAQQTHQGSDNNVRHLIDKERLSQFLNSWQAKIGHYSIFAAVPLLASAMPESSTAQKVFAPQVIPVEQASLPIRKRRQVQPGFLKAAGDYRLPYQKGDAEIFPSFTGSDACPGTPIPAGNYTAAAPYTDTGDTAGADDTVTRLTSFGYYYYYTADTDGPDRIYSFVVTSVGTNPEIKVTTSSPTYRPAIYITKACPSGTMNNVQDDRYVVNDSRWQTGNNTATINYPWSYLSYGRRYYLYIDSSLAGDGGPYTLTIKDLRIASAPAVRKARPDFDGDFKPDLSVFRPSDSIWYMRGSTQGDSAVRFGLPTDKIVPEDYDGDGKTDVAVFRESDGDWWILKSSNLDPLRIHWGQPGDIAAPGDFNGDGAAELAIFRSGQWWIYDLKTGQFFVVNFGQAGDKPVVGDYDGDGKADQAVYRGGIWYLNQSRFGYRAIRWGGPNDSPVPNDYFDDNTTDLAVFHDGMWSLYPMDSNYGYSVMWGQTGDIPFTSDFDDSGSAGIGVFRDGVWYVKDPWWGDTFYFYYFGINGDRIVPSAYNR